MDGRLCQKLASYIQYASEWRKEGTSLFEIPKQAFFQKVDQER